MSTRHQNKSGDCPSPPDLIRESESTDDMFDTDDFDDDTGDAATFKAKTSPASISNNSPTVRPSTIESFLSHYNTFSGSAFYADQGLKIVTWSIWAVSYLTHSKNSKSHLSPSLRKLYFDLNMTRYVLRFYGLLQAVEGFRSGSWAGGKWDNTLISKIAKYLMAGSMMFYHPFEHVAYLGWQMPNLVKVDANRFSAISCRFWCLYIVGDFWASCLKWRELKGKLCVLGELLTGKKHSDDKDAVMEILKEKNSLLCKIRHVKLQALRCLLFILPALTWSLPKWATDPLLSEPIVNGLMLIEAYTSVYQSLRAIVG